MAPSRPTLVRPESPWPVVTGPTLRPTRSPGRGQKTARLKSLFNARYVVTKMKLNRTLISPKPTKSRSAKPSKSPYNNCLISNYWKMQNESEIILKGVRVTAAQNKYFILHFYLSLSPPPPTNGKGAVTAYHETFTQGGPGKNTPTVFPLNHPAPRWRALRKERTGKPHERIKPIKQKHEDVSRHQHQKASRNPNRRREPHRIRDNNIQTIIYKQNTQVTLYHYTRVLLV